MVKPIPENIKVVLNELTGPQQVALRGYIATLRSEIKDLEEETLKAADSDPHAHYHGHEKCTADHEHGQTEHDEQKSHDHLKHKGHDHHEHKGHDHHEHKGHDHQEHKCHDHHDHKSHDHHEHDHHEHKSHDHVHHDHCEHESHAEKHGEDHHDHQAHKHAVEDKPDAVPAWKKAALSADPAAAPFGGDWKKESNISASKTETEDNMEM